MTKIRDKPFKVDESEKTAKFTMNVKDLDSKVTAPGQSKSN